MAKFLILNFKSPHILVCRLNALQHHLFNETRATTGINISTLGRLLYFLSLSHIANGHNNQAVSFTVIILRRIMTSENISDLDHLYSPSRWCRECIAGEKTSDECLQDHVRIITEESKNVQSSIFADLNVSYGKQPKEKYDLFGTDLPDTSPIIFYVHGGYWQEECIGRHNSSFVAKIFHKRGVKSFVIGYELCPKVLFEEIINQIQEAFRVCLDYAKIKGSRGICLMGHSAGAHLVAHLFATSINSLAPEDRNLLKSAFLVGGIYNLEPLLSTSYNIPLKLTPETAKEYSPINHRVADCPTKFFVVDGEYDTPAFVKQSEMMVKILKEQNISTCLMILENFDHFNIIEKFAEDDYFLIKSVLDSL